MMNRSVMERQMFRFGGPVRMQMGGDPMAAQMAMQDPMAGQMAAMPPAMPPEMGGMPPEMGGMPPEMGVGQIDPATLEQMLAETAPEVGDPEQAESYEEMMNMMRGDEVTAEERRGELASLVGEEDAANTPDSVLALLQPVLMMASAEEEGMQAGMGEEVDQGIGGLAAQEMQQPVEGNMAGGIMSMMGG